MMSPSLRRGGRTAWALLGILGVVVVVGLIVREVALLVIPALLALFPATLLLPVSRTLEGWKLGRTPAAIVTLCVSAVLFLGAVAGGVTLVVQELPELVDSAREGVEAVEEAVQRFLPEFQLPGVDAAIQMTTERLERTLGEGGEQGGALASGVLSVTLGAVEVLAGTILLFVFLFFYIRSGRELAVGVLDFIAPGSRERILPLAEEAWRTLGGYFRGQMLVALFDAVFIGIGLFLLGVPMVIPLAALTFVGGLFPIVGAVAAGLLAVLVALAHGGLVLGLMVALLVLAVQQIESNLLAPVILSRAVDLHPLLIILSVTLGGIVLGVLGAFLAVPTAAILKRVVTRLREGDDALPA
jgi:putative heme transporter